MAALGIDAGISKSEVSRICMEMDDELEAFRSRSLADTAYPYVYLDATYVKGRVGNRVVSRAVVVAMGVTADGTQEILGIEVGDSEDKVFWTEFIQGLSARGLSGVELVISKCHLGLKAAIAEVLVGAAWQRCRVHFKRNVLAKVPKIQGPMVSALISTIFAQPEATTVFAQLEDVATSLDPRLPVIGDMLRGAREDLCAFADFPRAHWTKLLSNYPLERVNAEIKRRTRVVGIFPNDASVLRLITAVWVEQHDEWTASDRRYLSSESMALLKATWPEDETNARSASLMT